MGSLKNTKAMGEQKPVVFDPDQWAKDIIDAREKTRPSEEETFNHMNKIRAWVLAFGVIGVLLASRGVVSLTSMVLICLCMHGRFTILAHHTLHGGYGNRRRGMFGRGPVRRILDWLDWILPEAWVMEHNKYHHYMLNEESDPDTPDRNTQFIRGLQLPLPVKYAIVFVTAATWKWYYYACNTLKLLHEDKPNKPADFKNPIVLDKIITRVLEGDLWYRQGYALHFVQIMAPPLLIEYILFPLVVGLIHGNGFCWCALLNVCGAELLANLHQFATIVTNHAGSDLWAFNDPCKADTPEFMLRAVLGSTAYHAGTDLIDYLHGWLNYQAEHHCFPMLSPLHYQRLHPHFKRICAAHGVPYVKEPVWTRVRKTADIVVGLETMPRISGQACTQPQYWAKVPVHE